MSGPTHSSRGESGTNVWRELELIEIDDPTGDVCTGDVELQLTAEEFVTTLPPDGVARLFGVDPSD